VTRKFFGNSPAFSDLPVFNPVEVDVETRGAFMRAFGSYKNEVSPSQHKLDLVYASVFREFFEVTLECRNSIDNTGFVADAIISVKVMRNFTVIP